MIITPTENDCVASLQFETLEESIRVSREGLNLRPSTMWGIVLKAAFVYTSTYKPEAADISNFELASVANRLVRQADCLQSSGSSSPMRGAYIQALRDTATCAFQYLDQQPLAPLPPDIVFVVPDTP